MKKAVLLALGLFLASGLGATNVQGEPVVLKAITAFPKNHLNNDPVPIFVDKVNKRAEGKLKIDWVGGPEVVKTSNRVWWTDPGY